jgi:REP element-mobilizing transposase RayT
MEQYGYARNAGAVFSLKYHLVFCPKYRKAVLLGPVAERLKVLLATKATKLHVMLHTWLSRYIGEILYARAISPL